MTLESDVDRWLRETNPPLESTFRRVTELRTMAKAWCQLMARSD
jgi:hypothetical protein